MKSNAVRLSKELSDEARRLFAVEWVAYNGWQPGGTCKRIAEATGLTVGQVQTAVFGDTKVAAKWRTEFAASLGRTA